MSILVSPVVAVTPKFSSARNSCFQGMLTFNGGVYSGRVSFLRKNHHGAGRAETNTTIVIEPIDSGTQVRITRIDSTDRTKSSAIEGKPGQFALTSGNNQRLNGAEINTLGKALLEAGLAGKPTPRRKKKKKEGH